MDKTLEIIMVAMTLVVAAVVVISMLQGQSGEFGAFADSERDNSKCGLEEVRYETSCNCDDPTDETTASENIRTGSSCDWAGGSNQCTDYCP